MVEVNPLILTKEEKVICLDAKVNFDSNALAALWQPASLYLAIDSFNDDFSEFLLICELTNHHLAQ